ncbi:MAG: hypothetical protein MRJ68_12350 [Nitrospira sp.]|nr:hypothetical protein [Nitrospira sp.]
MSHSLDRRGSRITRPRVRRDHPALALGGKPKFTHSSHESFILTATASLHSDRALAEARYPIRLTQKELGDILDLEYRPLLTRLHGILFREYGIREFGLKARIAEELAQDVMVALWEKANVLAFTNQEGVRHWLEEAARLSSRRWRQERARQYEKHVYPLPGGDEEHDPLCPKVTDAWDRPTKVSIWCVLEILYDRLHRLIDGPLQRADSWNAVDNELKMALTYLPANIRNIAAQVYSENVTWREMANRLDVDERVLHREVERYLRTLRTRIPSYQPSLRPVRKNTRRVRKSFHCPVCDTPLTWIKGSHGAVCTGCGIGIHKALFAIRESYHHA